MITSTQNAQVKRVIGLNQKAKNRKSEGLFVAEGWKMVREAPRDRIEKIYAAEGFFASHREELREAGFLPGEDGRFPGEDARFSGEDARFPGVKTCFPDEKTRFSKELSSGKTVEKKQEIIPVEITEDRVFRSMSDTQTPQGILCLVRQQETETGALLALPCPFFLILEDLQDPGNVGTIFRTAEGAGVSGIFLTGSCADLYNPKTVRSTMGSLYRMPFVRLPSGGMPELARMLQARGVALCGADMHGEHTYDQEDFRRPAAIVVGNEGRGLSDEMKGFLDLRVRIPMEGKLESLNAAVAAALLMYEVHRQRSKI